MFKFRDSPNLDLLRTFAVLAVLLDHIAGTFGIAQRYPSLFALGRWGVLLFFVHTSFVLMMSLGRLRLSGLRLFTTFYIRRFFRIYPLSMTAVAVTVGAYIPFTSWDLVYQQPSHRTILANLLLVQNLVALPSVSGPFWSLPYEVQMYLLLPVLFILLRKASLKPLIGIWIASIFFGLLQPWVAATRLGSHFYADRLGIAEFIPCFLVGVLAYQLSLRQKAPHLQFSTWAVSLGVMTIVYLLWESRVGYVGYPEWACCLPIGLVVVHCAECPHPRLNRWTHLIARYSYGIYLSQVSILWLVFVKLRALPPAQKWSLFVFLIVALPVASYHLLEEPFIKIGKALTPSKPKIYETHLELFSRRKPEQMQDGV